MLDSLLKGISKVWQSFQEKDSWLLLHISSAHSARHWWKLSNCSVLQLRRQPYSYSLALADLFSFLEVKTTLSKWRWLQDVVDSMEKVNALLNAVPKLTIFLCNFSKNTKSALQSMGLVCFWRDSPPSGPWPPHSRGVLDHTQRRTTVGRTPLGEWPARRRDLYLTTHITLTTNIHAACGIRTNNLSRRAATDLHLRPRGHWDQQSRGLLN